MIDSGDTGFMIICTALVLLMTPGLAFFYGGMVRRKNVVNTMMTSIFVIGIAMVMWILFGYSLAFGNDHLGIIGDLSFLGLSNVGTTPGNYASTIPDLGFAAFQMMFAIITPALITGAVAGRMKFKALFIFIIVWSTIVYYPMAHMVWGLGGFLAEIGSVDFAGGNVVHISSGVSALVLCIILGKRKDYDHAKYRIHNIPFVVLGASLLLFGWFGFNAGSSLKADGLAIHAFMTTAVAAGSPICYFMISKAKQYFGYDDALDAFGCHGIGGIWGGIATGLFAQTSINDVARWNGLFFGDTNLLIAQIISILLTIVVAVIGTLICIGVVRLFTPLRVDKRDEQMGLDMSEHNETAYPSFNGLE